MKVNWPYRAIRLVCVTSLFTWVTGASANGEPVLYVSSTVAPLGIKATKRTPETSIHVFVFANEDVKGIYDACLMSVNLKPLTAGSPEFPYTYGFCMERGGPVNGPTSLGTVRIPIPENIPEGSLYQIELTPVPHGLRDKNWNAIPTAIRNGFLIVRKKPLLPGDLDDNGTIQVKDALISLRVALNLSPDPHASAGNEVTPYVWSSGDRDHDGQLTLSDTISILRLAVGLDQ